MAEQEETTKYPRTNHLEFSPGCSEDDLRLSDANNFLNKTLIITEKLDGECTVMTRTKLHARSEAGFTHPWQHYVRSIHGRIKYTINPGEIIYGENLYAIHSIEYSDLTDYLYVFMVVVDKTVLSWPDTKQYCSDKGLSFVPELGIVNIDDSRLFEAEIKKFEPEKSFFGPEVEGYVIRNQESFLMNEFSKNVAKFVRKYHVKTDKHWPSNWKAHKIKVIK